MKQKNLKVVLVEFNGEQKKLTIDQVKEFDRLYKPYTIQKAEKYWNTLGGKQ